MKRGSFAASFLTCLLLAGVTTTAYAAGIVAERSHHRIVVDGKEAQMEAYPNTGTGAARFTGAGNVKSNTLPGEPCQLAWLSLLHPRLI